MFYSFSWDVKLPVVLDFEIWKASNMLFQNIPRGTYVSKGGNDYTSNWNDFWYRSFPDDVEPSMIRPQNNSDDTTSLQDSNENNFK